jgi:hypothetical protein
MALTHGLAPVPNIDVWAAAGRAFPHPAGGTYIEASPVGPALAHLLRCRSSNAYAALHLGLVVVATVALIAIVRRRFGDAAATLAVVALFASPLANVLLTWLGQPDPIVLGLGAVAAMTTPPAAIGAAAFALGVVHTEQAIAIVVLLLLVRSAVGDLRRSQATSLAVGVVSGAAVVAVFKQHYGIDASRLAYAQDIGLGEFTRNFLTMWHLVLVASFGATWALVLMLGRRLDRRQRLSCTAAFVAALTMAFFTLDTTRVFALVTFPVVLVLIGHAVRTLPRQTLDRVLAIVLVAGALYPHIVVWEGHSYVSSLSRTIDWFAR